MAFSRQDIDDHYFAQEKIPRIDPAVLKELSRLKPWRSIFAIAMDWAIIIACIVACENFGYWLYPFAFVIVGTRFHGLEAMMHEATHFRIHPSKRINEFIGELCVWPLGMSAYLYRHARHFGHHKNIGTVKDAHVFQSYKRHPGLFAIPSSPGQLLRNCVKVAARFPNELWLGQLYLSARILTGISKKHGRLWVAFQLALFLFIIAACVVWGWKALLIYLLFFVLPLIWVAVFSRYLRLLAEHFGIPNTQQNTVAGGETRTVLVSWPVRVMLWPHNLNYHLEHHWYPSVPFYNLPALHKILFNSPEIRPRMHVTKGLKQLASELVLLKNR